MRRLVGLVLLACAAAAAASPTDPAPSPPAQRPKLGLVLSGGGARGLAHVGVLKVLERERIPVDLIAGTSMGAIIGGLYASGMTATELERELLQINWGRVFSARVERQELSQRRKEEDFEFSPLLELGLRDGELRAPQGTLSSRGLEALLRRLTLPVRMVQQFDQLPIPFRAVATNMEDGQQVVVGEGDLALAMRSSMSVPGVFAPIEWNERILGDGGLVNNLPVDIARRMGAEQLIAVNVGTPLSGRSALGSVVGLTGQMINILTEQNVQRSLASLWNEDILLTPNLGKLTSADFERGRDFIAQGEAATEALLPRLRQLALPEAEYERWRLAHRPDKPAAPSLEAVAFEGSDNTNPQRFKAQLETQPGQVFDPAKAERDTRKLASSGDYVRVDYHVEQRPEGDTLVFLMEDKPWGPNYFRVGLDLSTDFAAESSFNLRLSHNRHWLTDHGTEWRNQLTLGQTPRFYTELYHPLIQKLGTSEDWFVSSWGEVERRQINIYEPETGKGLARLARQSGQIGLDLGQPWGRLGEVRLGLTHQRWRITPKLLTIDVSDDVFSQTWSETGIRLKTVIDQLDFANFPQRGYRLVAEAISGQQGGTNTRRQHFSRFELQGTAVGSLGAHTLNLHARLLQAKQPTDSTQGPYTLGGFQQLSGYQQGQLYGNTLAFARATYYLRLREAPVLTRGFFVGGSLEVGNAWAQRSDASLKDLRYAASAFIGADTGFGPLYLAFGRAPRGGSAVYLFIGRP